MLCKLLLIHPFTHTHNPMSIGCHARQQTARQGPLGIRCLAQRHFNTSRAGSTAIGLLLPPDPMLPPFILRHEDFQDGSQKKVKHLKYPVKMFLILQINAFHGFLRNVGTLPLTLTTKRLKWLPQAVTLPSFCHSGSSNQAAGALPVSISCSGWTESGMSFPYEPQHRAGLEAMQSGCPVPKIACESLAGLFKSALSCSLSQSYRDAGPRLASWLRAGPTITA